MRTIPRMAEPTPDQLHEQYVYALGRITGLAPGGGSERIGPWLCIDAGLGVSKFNIAVVVDSVSNPKAALRDLMEWYAYRGINPRLDLRGSADSGLLAAAMVENFQFWWREPVMVLHPIPAFETPQGLEVRTVHSDADIDLYCAVDREEYSDQEFQRLMVERSNAMEGVTLHLGLDPDGRPVARSMAVTRGPLVGVHNVYVPPSERRKGYGAALTAVAIGAGRDAGAESACLEATALGFPVYQRMGFRRVDDYVCVGLDSAVFPK
jgi:GNAT superfamily N-acetyltransferase